MYWLPNDETAVIVDWKPPFKKKKKKLYEVWDIKD